MSVKVRPYRNRGWEVDIQAVLPDGTRTRVRRKAPVASRSEATRWGQQLLRQLLLQAPTTRKEVLTIAEFAPRFLDGYARANRHKPSGIAAKETILRVHIVPLLGHKRLDQVSTEDVQALKAKLEAKAPKTVNNVLSVLSMLLRLAEEWSLIEQAPCRVKLVRTPPAAAQFHDFEQYERLVEASLRVSVNAHLVVLLGGEAGLRCGEMMALEWTDVDLQQRQILVSRSEWRGHVTEPKGGRIRCVPLTQRLTRCLRAHRHLRQRRVLCHDDGSPLTQKVVQGLVSRAARRALLVNDGVHTLRHTFCSHLAMRGAPARAIQELAGHRDLSTTQRYMHLSPAAVQAAIQLLDTSPTDGDGTTARTVEK